MIMYCLSKILYSMQSPRLKGLLVAILCTLSYTFSVAQITTVPYFEGFEDLEKSEKKSGILAKIGIFIIIVILGVTIFLILNSIFEWNII